MAQLDAGRVGPLACEHPARFLQVLLSGAACLVHSQQSPHHLLLLATFCMARGSSEL